jgi:tRNA threonylcarbamoyladenosine biosynthesis protein TsaB
VKLLAIDTSTDWISVAATDGGSTRDILLEAPASNAHSEHVMPLVDRALGGAGWRLADLDAIAFGAGPGAFTGVRIACAVAQGLALGAGIALVAIGTLEAIAESARRQLGGGRVVAALDARMQEVYVAAYAREGDAWREVVAPLVARPDDVDVPRDAWLGAGDGFARYPALAQRVGASRVHADVRPGARAIAALAAPRVAAGDVVAAHDAHPVYVRHRVALTLAEREAGVHL